MEPKKKRGRPKGSGKKEKVAEFNPDKLQQEFEKVYGPVTHMQTREMVLVKDDNNIIAVPKATFPSNWDTMGKIDRLKWLKSHQK